VSDDATTATQPVQDPDHDMVVGTPAEREAEREYGLQEIPPEELPLLPGEVTHHPSPFQYVVVAMVLVVVTALEVGVSYLEGDIPNGLIIVLLLAMGLFKFVVVASWYMHLKTDQPIFRRFFIVGGIAAVVLYTVVLTTLHVWS
jgi:cytochrome c oxidase subunit 4